MPGTSFFKNLLPVMLSYLLLLFAALALDYLLHIGGLGWVGRYLGIPGTALILTSFIYSLRKRRIIRRGAPGKLLAFHEEASWIGSVLILVHAGVHFNTLLPWLAVAAMMIVVASGHFGKYLLKNSRESLGDKKRLLMAQGIEGEELERKLFWDAVAVRLMNQWRVIHIPVVIVFATLALLHILAIFFFWNWK
ncbi:MAG: hypothetical protein KDI06_18350 [Calditrichaeota bacterium]|nr:hypothetical protein [Calditrichota bacterium]